MVIVEEKWLFDDCLVVGGVLMGVMMVLGIIVCYFMVRCIVSMMGLGYFILFVCLLFLLLIFEMIV